MQKSKEPDYVKLRQIADWAEKLAPLSMFRFRQLLAQAVVAAGDQPQFAECLMLYAPATPVMLSHNLGDV